MNRAAVVLCALALAVLSVLPISRTLYAAFTDQAPDGSTHLSLRPVDEALIRGAPRDPEASEAEGTTPATRPIGVRRQLLGNSVAIAALAALLALAVGVPYALLVTRTDVPFARALGTVYAAPLVLPPLLVAMSWTFLPGFEPPPVTSAAQPTPFGGLVALVRAACLFALCWFPLVVLFAKRAFARNPASLEELARLAGGPGMALRRVTLPLAAPGILAGALFVFLFALNDFSLVDYLNWVRPLSDQIRVYPFESFTAWSKTQGEHVATALGLPLALLGVGLLFAIHRLVGRGARASVTGEFREAARWNLGAWRFPALLAACALLFVSVGLPIAGLVHKAASLNPGDVQAHALRGEPPPTPLDNYRAVWRLVAGPESSSHEVAWTLYLSIGAAVLTVPLAFVLGHHAARTRRIGLLVLSILPLALPPVFLGAGYLRLLNLPELSIGGRNPFLDQDGPRLGSMLLLVAKYAPFAVVAAWAAFLEIDPRLEESAATAGIRPLDRALGLLSPLARPALALGAALVFVLALREIDTIVLLSSDTVMRRIYTMVHFQRDAQVAALCVILIGMETIPLAAYALLFPRERGRVSP